jgi:hypothetical protein
MAFPEIQISIFGPKHHAQHLSEIGLRVIGPRNTFQIPSKPKVMAFSEIQISIFVPKHHAQHLS